MGRRARSARRGAPVPLSARLYPVACFALPAATPVIVAGVVAGVRAVGAAEPAEWIRILLLPLASAIGVAGAFALRDRIVLGSAISIGLGALFSLASPVVLAYYGLPALLMGYTARRMRGAKLEAGSR